jgi:hypothetical protein
MNFLCGIFSLSATLCIHKALFSFEKNLSFIQENLFGKLTGVIIITTGLACQGKGFLFLYEVAGYYKTKG